MCSFNTSRFVKVRKVDICCVNGSNVSWDKDLHLNNKFQLRKKNDYEKKNIFEGKINLIRCGIWCFFLILDSSKDGYKTFFLRSCWFYFKAGQILCFIIYMPLPWVWKSIHTQDIIKRQNQIWHIVEWHLKK